MVADGATAALRLFDRHPPDLLISDIEMPEMDGYRLIQQIRQRSPSRGRLSSSYCLTAYASEYDHQQALTAGFQQHLVKPSEPEALVNAIVSVLNQG